MDYKTEQEKFWAGEFGDDYIERNKSAALAASNLNFFSNCLKSCDNLNNLLEVGSNIGMNLFALKSLLPNAKTSAVEINSIAAKALKQKLPECDVFNGSFLDYQCDGSFDLVFTKGVLIHFSPDVLPSVYRKMYELSSRYILICEYFNPIPISIEYRGFKDKLFKRDFCKDLMDHFPLDLVDYGFAYKHDRKFSQDNINWFLLEKSKRVIG